VLARVLQRHDNQFNGTIVTIQSGRTRIEVTANHPFWVIEGRRLTQRDRPVQLNAGEDENQSLHGRWVNSQDLEVGDQIYGFDGKRHLVESLQQRRATATRVCNLTVQGRHTFFVGAESILVHNTAWCELLEKKIGKAIPEALKNFAKKKGFKIHGHHIVQKTTPKQWELVKFASKVSQSWSKSKKMAWYIGKSQKMLEDAGIPLLKTEQELLEALRNGESMANLAWAINGNGTHTLETVKAVYEALLTAGGDKEKLIRILNEIAKKFATGEPFRGF
jgi:hypothetical protein